MVHIALLFETVVLSSCIYAQKATPATLSTASGPTLAPAQTAPTPEAQSATQVIAPGKERAEGVPKEAKPIEAKKVEETAEEKRHTPSRAPAAIPATANEPITAPNSEATDFDVDALSKRLKQTSAIGVLTKLAINSEATDLIDAVKKYRKLAVLEAKLGEIRSRFDGLMMKILALLEDDPSLARDIHVAREQIWSSLLEVPL